MAFRPHVFAGSLPNASQIFCHDFAPIPFIRNASVVGTCFMSSTVSNPRRLSSPRSFGFLSLKSESFVVMPASDQAFARRAICRILQRARNLSPHVIVLERARVIPFACSGFLAQHTIRPRTLGPFFLRRRELKSGLGVFRIWQPESPDQDDAFTIRPDLKLMKVPHGLALPGEAILFGGDRFAPLRKRLSHPPTIWHCARPRGGTSCPTIGNVPGVDGTGTRGSGFDCLSSMTGRSRFSAIA